MYSENPFGYVTNEEQRFERFRAKRKNEDPIGSFDKRICLTETKGSVPGEAPKNKILVVLLRSTCSAMAGIPLRKKPDDSPDLTIMIISARPRILLDILRVRPFSEPGFQCRCRSCLRSLGASGPTKLEEQLLIWIRVA